LLLTCTLLGAEIEFGNDNLTIPVAQDGTCQLARNRTTSLFTVTLLENTYGLDAGKHRTLDLHPVSQQGDQFTLAPSKEKLPRFTFKTTDKGDYFTLRLVLMENPKDEHAVVLTMQWMPSTNWMPLDAVTKKTNRLAFNPSFFGVMQRNKSNPLGAIALWKPSNEAQDDEVLYQVWASEGLPHPKVKGEWTVARAKQWVADWTNTFRDHSIMYIGPRKPEDLKVLADEAAAWGLSGVYLHLNSWGDRYWPSDRDNFEVNTNLFPGGRKDMVAFGDYLASKGLGLTFRTVSYSLGGKHPKYLGTKPDPRLARWWSGTLVKDADAEAKNLVVTPDKKEYTRYDPNRRWSEIFDRRCMQIGNELVQYESYTDNQDGTWTLKGCRRGLYATKPTSHKVGEQAIGLYRIYGIAFAPDPDSTLIGEMGKRFAEFHNDVKAKSCNFDALEVHKTATMYGTDKFMGAVYSHLDHPVWSDTSGGNQYWGFIEKHFHSARKELGLHRPPRIPHEPSLVMGLHTSHWSASSPYAYCYAMVPNVVAGLNERVVYEQAGFRDVTTELLQKHGLIKHYRKAMQQWRQHSKRLPEPLRKRILASWRKDPFAVRYPLIDEIFRLQGEGKDGEENLQVVPFQVMKRKTGDRSWSYLQEHGLVYPYQYIRPGQKLTVKNPYGPQVPEFIIRVMSDFNRNLRTVKVDTADASEAKKAFNAMLDKFRAASGVTLEEEPAKSLTGQEVSYQIMPELAKVQQKRNAKEETTFVAEGNGVRVSCKNDGNSPLHFLEGRDDTLPWYRVKTDITNAGGLGMVVTGDGSGAMLVVRISGQGTRDYVVKLDFKGCKYVEIPSPQVAWANGDIPFYSAYKRWHSNSISRISLGLENIPPKSKATVLIEDLRFLPEKHSALVNPELHLGAAKLCITGVIPTGSYLWYQGGKSVAVYDLNWNKVKELSVTLDDGKMPAAWADIKVINHNPQSAPWLEVQFFAADQGVLIPPLNNKEKSKIPLSPGPPTHGHAESKYVSVNCPTSPHQRNGRHILQLRRQG